eukprot:TRINITY_DN22810_c0_g1_i1.p1 TRINITY_DN22810_c0_g1~~TRINITY_DN22810_c0_g1_i1.p1  ORF type:complete len:854 (-),score=133.87 TRINITY_DN22810_c0_g1_i1:148-2709(-)
MKSQFLADKPSEPEAEAPPAADDSDGKTKSKPKPTVKSFFEKLAEKEEDSDASASGFDVYTSFHTLHVSKDMRHIFLEIKKPALETLFFHHLIYEGAAGTMPQMWDATGRAVGLHFAWAPNKQDVQLVEAQQRLDKGDFAATMYDSITGGLLRGYIEMFQTLVREEDDEGSVLLDLSTWLTTFGRDNSSPGMLVAVRAFSQNFMLRLSTQHKGITEYWTTSFCVLPEKPMVPRPFDRRVGYFTTPILVGGSVGATGQEHIIHKWDLKRRQGKLWYCIDPTVPQAYHATLKQAVEAWNKAFKKSGFEDPVLRCVAPGDPDWPEDYSRGDARFIAIHMTDPHIPVLGYGPSVVDFRSGEILAASIVLGFRPFLEFASQYSLEVLDDLGEIVGCGNTLPLLDADHPDVLRALLKTTIHEVGHTLGLRHNFIAAEDGNSSVMEYVDPLDTSDPSSPRFGGHFLQDIGNYDEYAIRYGYTVLSDESRGVRHPALALLANGQDPDETLAEEPRNPLFATDENVNGADPRVHRFNSSARRFAQDKLVFAITRREELLKRVDSGGILPQTYSRKLFELMNLAYMHVLYAINFVGGAELDKRRVIAEPCSASDTLQVLRSVADFTVGPLFRLSASEAKHFFLLDPSSVYSAEPADVLASHSALCSGVLRKLLDPQRLARLESQRLTHDTARSEVSKAKLHPPFLGWLARGNSQSNHAAGPRPLRTYDLLMNLAFGSGHSCESLLHPFSRAGLQSRDNLAQFTLDPLRAEARLQFAQRLASLQATTMHAAVRAGAEGFAHGLRRMIEPVLRQCSDEVAAPWRLFVKATTPSEQQKNEPRLHRPHGDDEWLKACRCCNGRFARL